MIRKNVPIPGKPGKNREYPELYEMDIGDSFERPVREYLRLHTTSQYCRRKTGRRFTMRRSGQKVAIWRVE